MNNFWEAITVSELKENYPTMKDDILARFLKDVQHEEKYPSINITQFNLDEKYPSEFLSDNKLTAVVANAAFYQNGYSEAMLSEYIKDYTFQSDWGPEDFEDYNAKTPEERKEIRQGFEAHREALEHDLEIIKQMPEFYKEAVNDAVAAFKNENPAFKDVQIPYNHPPMPDYLDVNHNGKTVLCEVLGNQSVQATQFCLMKDPADSKSPYFVLAARVDKVHDRANYKMQNLTTRNLFEAQKMFDDVVAGRPPKGLSIKEKLDAAIAKVSLQERQPGRSLDRKAI